MTPPVQTAPPPSRFEPRHRLGTSGFKIGLVVLAVAGVVLLSFVAGKLSNDTTMPIQTVDSPGHAAPVTAGTDPASYQVAKPVVPDDLESFVELQLSEAAQGQMAPASATDMSAEQVFAKAASAVVLIEMRGEGNTRVCTGSGFFIDDQGTLVTNAHVVFAEGALFAVVKLSDDRPYIVEDVFASDRDADIAILKVTGHKGGYLPLADTLPNVGEKVYAVGNPLGLRHTITDGIVSQVRAMDEAHAAIQTSAPISPGNSGGPLIDGRGRAVGVNTLAFNVGQNLNFAVASTVVRHLLKTSSSPGVIESGKMEGVSASARRAFELIVEQVALRVQATPSTTWLETNDRDPNSPTFGLWGKSTKEHSQIRYVVKETGLRDSPYKGAIQVKVRSYSWGDENVTMLHCRTEREAIALTRRHRTPIEFDVRAEYVWRNGDWIHVNERDGKWFPFTDSHYEEQNDMLSARRLK